MKDGLLLKIILILAFLLFTISWGIWKSQYKPKAAANPVQPAFSSPPARQR